MKHKRVDPVVNKAIEIAVNNVALKRSMSRKKNWGWIETLDTATNCMAEKADLPLDPDDWRDVFYNNFDAFIDSLRSLFGDNIESKLRSSFSDRREINCLLKLPLKTLDLPTRVENILLDVERVTVSDLVIARQVKGRFSEKSWLLELNGFGEKSLEAVDSELKRHRLTPEQLRRRANANLPDSKQEWRDRHEEWEQEFKSLTTIPQQA